MQIFQQDEATAAQRRLFFHAVDATDGITAETGLTGAGRVTENGATSAASASITEIDATNMPGRYYIELTALELSTVGVIEFRYKAAACAEVVARGQVVPWDIYDVVRLGATALPNAAAEAAGGLYTRGTGAGQINQGTNGRVDTNIVAMAANVLTAAAINAAALTAAKFAANSIEAAALATDAINKIARAIGIQQNQAFSDIQFLMVDSTDHVTPKTGLTVTGERVIDGAAAVGVSGVIAEISDGLYQFDAVAADTNGAIITYRFSSATADDRFLTITTVA